MRTVYIYNVYVYIYTGADPGFEKGGFNVVPKSDTWWRNSRLFMKTPLGVNCRELKIIIS